jgi:hypothetical protein
VFLQPQKYSIFDSSASNLTGRNSVSWWEPSQKGWFTLFPQAHQKYDLPPSTSTAKGDFWAIVGSDMLGDS